MAEDLGEKTEQPTARRRQQSRGDGQVPKSTDLSAAIDLASATLLIATLGGGVIASLAGIVRGCLGGRTPGGMARLDGLNPAVIWAAGEAVKAALPLFAIMFLLALIGQVVQVGWLFTTKPLRPKIDRLNPVTGAKKLLSRRNLVKTLVNSIKMAVVVATAWLIFSRHMPRVLSLPLLDAAPAFAAIGLLVLELALWLLAILILIGLIDFAYQRWQHTQDLKMTKQQVKDERRSMDGDPEVKAKRYRMAQEIAMQRIQRSVPEADVVVTNPTHFSVAIRYDQSAMRAPKVTAKGADFLAFRIRHVAIMHGVPIVERPPLARALYHATEEGHEISAEHYQAVAEVLAYVYRMEGRAA